MTNQARDLIQRLADTMARCEVNHRLLDEAYAYLAQSEPEGPNDAELDEETATVISWLLESSTQAVNADQPHAAGRLLQAAQLLGERHQRPTPIPLSERQPTDGEWVWHCYASVRFWQYGQCRNGQFFVGKGPESFPATHWLPHWALPVPEQEAHT